MELENAIYMIPVPISDEAWQRSLPVWNVDVIKSIKHFIVENVRTSRRFLKRVDHAIDISSLTFNELNQHTEENEISSYLSPLRNGEAIGIMSEAGCPGVADPGAKVVRIAQEEGYKVIPLVGPSSILLSLMASGLNGQKFSFHGYLPVENSERGKAIKNLENQSRRDDMTQIFIETPYRNQKMMDSLLQNLANDTLLCVAADVTSPQEKILTRSVKEWKNIKMELEKVPTIFLFYSPQFGKARIWHEKK